MKGKSSKNQSRSFLRYIFVATCFAFVAASVVIHVLHREVQQAVEQLLLGEDLESPGSLASEIYDRHGRKVGEFAHESRYFVGLDAMPLHLLQAFIAVEDSGFQSHRGLSFKAILRAAWANMIHGRIVQGGSTITQQLARISFLNNRQTLRRKLREAVVALTLEAVLSKRRILELYLNKIYLGNRSYGVEAASRNYFRKSVSDLNIGESAMLAGLAAAPSSYAPHKHFAKAKARQRVVLGRMVEEGYLEQRAKENWQKVRLSIATGPLAKNISAPYFVTELKRHLDRMFEMQGMERKGLKIKTSLDLKVQSHLRRQLQANVARYFPDVYRSGRLRMGFMILATHSGEILAMQGGSNFAARQFNHTTQARRALGSLFMPIYYALALERGFEFMNSLYTQGAFVPKNGSVPASSDLSLFEGLVHGRTVESSRLVAWLGTGTVLQQAREFGLKVRHKDLSLALGKVNASLWQMMAAFSAFHNGGFVVRPHLVQAIDNQAGHKLYRSQIQRRQVVGQAVALMVREALAAAVAHGAAVGGKLDYHRVSGMVGTDRSRHDAWYIGAVGPWLAGIWVGTDKGRVKLADREEEIRKAIGQVWAGIVRGLTIPVRRRISNRAVAYARYKFLRNNLGSQSVPFRLRSPSQAF